MRLRFCLLALLPFTLSSCRMFSDSLDQSEIPGYTKDWVREHDGQVLSFRNAAGQVHRLSVSRQEGKYTTSSRFGSQEVAYLRAQYHDDTDSLLSFDLSAFTTTIDVQRHDTALAQIATHSKIGHILFYSINQQGLPDHSQLVIRDTTLGGRPFRYLGRLRLRPHHHAVDTLTEIYVSRYDGVVGFTTNRAGLWMRQ